MKNYKLTYLNFKPYLIILFLLVIGFYILSGWKIATFDTMCGHTTIIFKKYI